MVADTTSETVWIHGHAGRLQATTGFVHERLGYFLRLKADMDGEAWVHYAIPVTLGPRRRVVSAVAVQLRTWGRGEIGTVHLWNGSTRLAATEAGLSSPVGVEQLEDEEPDVLGIHDLGLSSEVPISAALGVSLLIKARKPRDAVAIAGVGVTTSADPRAGVS